MGLLDGYFDPQQFGEGGGLLGRLLALQRQRGRYQPAPPQTSVSQAPERAIPWYRPCMRTCMHNAGCFDF
jgi:hypothetical protein